MLCAKDTGATGKTFDHTGASSPVSTTYEHTTRQTPFNPDLYLVHTCALTKDHGGDITAYAHAVYIG